MSKIEKEVKILDIEIKQLKKKLESLGATLKSDGVQKIYVYDLPSIYARFYDCMMQLEKCSKPYDIEICKSKLKALFLEIDNLMTQEQQDSTFKAIGYKHLNDTLSIQDVDRLKDILSKAEVVRLVKQFGINPNKWVRLRETNGKTTITIKHILNEELQKEYGTKMQPVLETEMEVPSIESGNAILEQLGFSFRNYQEKKRITYVIDNTEVDIDSWPLIPPYLEVEGESDEQIDSIVRKLELSDKEIVSCNTAEIYKKYGLDIYQYRELRFNEKEKGIEL